MDFPGYELPDRLRSLQRDVRGFMQERVLPLEQHMDPEATELDDEALRGLQQEAKGRGLWALWAPSNLGGGGLGTFAQTVLLEELAQHRNGLYNPGYGVFGRFPPSLCYECSPEQAEKYVIPAIRDGKKTFFAMSEPQPAEPSGGADPAGGIRMTAVRDGAYWVLNGTKTWISNGAESEWGIVFARTDVTGGSKGVSCFFFETDSPGLEATLIPTIRPDYPATLAFKNCLVPRESLLGQEGEALAMASRMLTRNRLPYSVANLGVAVAALRLATEHCRARETSIKWMLADCEVEVRSVRWLLWEAAWKADRGEDYRLEASIAKLCSSEALGRVVDRAMQIYGGYGMTKELPLERWYREARGRRVAAGPTETLQHDIARRLMEG